VSHVSHRTQPNTDDQAESHEEGERETQEETQPGVSRSGRTINAPTRLIEEMGSHAGDYKITLSTAEVKYYAAMKDLHRDYTPPGEMICVGAGLGGGFVNTNELHVMKYEEAMASDKKGWQAAVKEEHERMKTNSVFVETPRTNVPKGAKILSTTWACKKKSNGTYRARLNARGYEQVDGEHYNENTKAAPVVSDATIYIVLIFWIMACWYAEVMDLRGAFLHGDFEPGQKMFVYVPKGFEE
jgi:hypothetical protein